MLDLNGIGAPKLEAELPTILNMNKLSLAGRDGWDIDRLDEDRIRESTMVKELVDGRRLYTRIYIGGLLLSARGPVRLLANEFFVCV